MAGQELGFDLLSNNNTGKKHTDLKIRIRAQILGILPKVSTWPLEVGRPWLFRDQTTQQNFNLKSKLLIYNEEFQYLLNYCPPEICFSAKIIFLMIWYDLWEIEILPATFWNPSNTIQYHMFIARLPQGSNGSHRFQGDPGNAIN